MHHFGGILAGFRHRFQCEKVQQSAILCDHSAAESWATAERMSGPTTCYRRMVNRASPCFSVLLPSSTPCPSPIIKDLTAGFLLYTVFTTAGFYAVTVYTVYTVCSLYNHIGYSGVL
jgi:hypothetical protein